MSRPAAERAEPAPRRPEALLRIEDLKKHFPVKTGVLARSVGLIRAVDGISFAIDPGETFSLVGESGCGKSTTGRMIAGLYAPTAGRIVFDGKALDPKVQRSKTFRRAVQMIFQDPYSSLNPRKTVGAILEAPFEVHGLYSRAERKQRVADLLARVSLDASLRNRYPHEFSGGQRQRIGIARALALEPELIVADEPVSALDVSIQSQILNIFEDLKGELGLTYLFISHDLAVVKHISDRIGVMYLGRLMEVAAKRELYAEPLHPYTRALLSAVPRSHPALPRREHAGLSGEPPSAARPPSGCVFRTRCPAVMPRCAEVVPPLGEVRPGHAVACHLYD